MNQYKNQNQRIVNNHLKVLQKCNKKIYHNLRLMLINKDNLYQYNQKESLVIWLVCMLDI